MSRWFRLRDFLKDVVLTGLGVVVVWHELFSAHPNGFLIGVGVALTTPRTWEHLRALLPGGDDGPSSPSSSSPGPEQPGTSSHTSSEVSGE